MEPSLDINPSNTNSSTSSSDGSEDNLHPISCIRCRRLHKKCDKNLKGCSKCSSAGLTCTYNTPQKRGKASEHYSTKKPSKKKKTIQSSSSTIVSSTSTTTTAIMKDKVLTPDRMIDIYFTCICGIHPMIEKDKLKYFVNHCLEQFDNKSENELTLKENIWIKSIGEMKCIHALYLSLMVVCSQIIADLESVDIYIRKCEIYISNISVDHSLEFYWAVACHYLYIGFIGDGNEYKSGYYLSMVNYFIQSQQENSEISMNSFYKILISNSNLISSRYKSESFTLQKLMEGMKNMFFFFTNRSVEDILLPGTWEYMMNTQLSQHNFLLFKQVSDFIFKVLNHFKQEVTKSVKDCHGDEFFRIQGLFSCFLSEGFAFMFMKQIPEISFSVMEEISLKITLMTEHELFPTLFLSITGFVIESSEFHLEICKDIERGLKLRMGTVMGSSGKLITFDYFNILEKDLRALKVLSERYRRVIKYYGKLMSEMSEIIQRNRREVMGSGVVEVISESSGGVSNIVVEKPPQQDDILRKQLDQLDFESFLADNPSTPWDDFI